MSGWGVKPGRSQSAIGVAAGVIFGIVTLAMAGFVASTGAPGIFVFVPIMMALLGFIGAGVSMYNATAKNRMSSIEILDIDDEPDPLTPRSAREEQNSEPDRRFPGGFCPYCGARVEADHNFCPACGKDI